jgi:acyl-CoA synthetase (NDP forming)
VFKVVESLKTFFEPKSVAIIGASRTPGKAGYGVMKNLLDNEYAGSIYPVNPNVDEVLGYKAYASVKDLPEAPDVAIIIIPASATVEAVRECAEKGVKAVVIASGGFAEVDEYGARLQKEIVRIAGSSGMRVIGPNTSGIISTPSKFTSTFFPLGKIRRGTVAYIAQTGNFATHTMKWILTSEYYGVSRVIGLGNKCDVDDADALEYLGEDPETRVICMYLEGFKNGRRLLEVASKVSKKKPIIALKAGYTTAGMRATLSHTASLASHNSIVDAAFKQAGIVRVQYYTDLINAAKALAFQPLPSGNRVAILAPSGAMGVIAADACETSGLKVANLSEQTLRHLQSISPNWIKVGNPIDIWAAVQIQGLEQGYRLGMEAALNDENVDAVISILMLTSEHASVNLEFIQELCEQHPHKPVLISITGDRELFDKAKVFLESRSIPVYLPVEDACRVLAIMYKCKQAMIRRGLRPY